MRQEFCVSTSVHVPTDVNVCASRPPHFGRFISAREMVDHIVVDEQGHMYLDGRTWDPAGCEQDNWFCRVINSSNGTPQTFLE